MKKLILILAILAVALPAFAQKATLDTPNTGATIVDYEVAGWDTSIESRRVLVKLYQRNANGDRLPRIKRVIVESFTVPDPETGEFTRTWVAFLAFQQLSDNARAGETGAVERRINFRVLGYLVDEGLLTGVTLVP